MLTAEVVALKSLAFPLPHGHGGEVAAQRPEWGRAPPYAIASTSSGEETLIAEVSCPDQTLPISTRISSTTSTMPTMPDGP